jgi:hypothetical protein
MIPVVIQYRPVPVFPFTRRRRFLIPQQWSEISERQLLNLPRFLYAAEDNKREDVWKVSLFLGVSRFFAARLDSYQRYSILKQLSYLQKAGICDRFIIPRIGKLKSPEALLKNVTFGAFIYGDTYFQKFIEGDESALDKFIACYYLEDGKFDDARIDDTCFYLQGRDHERKLAVVNNYKLIREWLAKMYPYVFEKRESKQKAGTGGWVYVFDAIVGDDLVNQEKYAQQPLSMVLRFMNRKTKDYHKSNRNGS